MQPAALRIDPRPVAQVVATMLQAFRRAGAGSAGSASVPNTTYENRADPGNASTEVGLHLPAPIHPQASPSAPGEHRTSVRAQGQGAATGLASGTDPHSGSRPGDLGHPDGQPTRFPTTRVAGLIAESRSGLCFGGFPLVALGLRLASFRRLFTTMVTLRPGSMHHSSFFRSAQAQRFPLASKERPLARPHGCMKVESLPSMPHFHDCGRWADRWKERCPARRRPALR